MSTNEMTTDLQETTGALKTSHLAERFQQLTVFLNKRIMGQENLVSRLLIALLADGHLLVEGAPGLAKTRAIKVLSSAIDSQFHRIQFTPDLLPADITGTEIYRMETGQFEFQKGPLFHNILLADEINRAPAKVQSALLEAMAERQVSVGKNSYSLPDLFLVMATQNPLEQEGTYPLPEAQLDRFLMKVHVGYPTAQKELEILNLVLQEAKNLEADASLSLKPLLPQELFAARKEALNLFMAETIERYIVQIVLATRDPAPYGMEFTHWITCGASPRATISLARCAKALAFLQGETFVGPHHVQALAKEVLRHRIILSYAAEAEGISVDDFIEKLLVKIPVP